MRIIVAGSFAATPDQGGAASAVLQYASGCELLGHEVLLIDQAPHEVAVLDCFRDALDAYAFRGARALIHGLGDTYAMSWAQLVGWFTDADLLINLAGALKESSLLQLARRRLFVDVDPCFTQLWQTSEGIDMGLSEHTHHATYGHCIGTSECAIPDCGVDWIPTLPPVVIDQWLVAESPPRFGLTTVANWRSYGSITRAGVHYGQKVHSFRSLVDLPRVVAPIKVEPALSIHPDETDDLRSLREHGWALHDASEVASDVGSYRTFIQASTAEIGIAKSGYVASRCGWFSDRSAAYLASGRPVIAQDTGWTSSLPAGEGLLPFDDVPQAAAAIDSVCRSYDRHTKAAREIAIEHLDCRRVLTRLLDEVGR
jgi:hypothetical protein